MPHLDTRLCMLLSITTLVIADLVEEEEGIPTAEFKNETGCKNKVREDLIFSLQKLHDYQTLLTPPTSVVPAANQAAAKAMMILSGINANTGYFECFGTIDMPINCCKQFPFYVLLTVFHLKSKC